MLRFIGFLAVMAAVFVTAATYLGLGAPALQPATATTGQMGLPVLDHVSVAVGFLAGIMSGWVYRVPWMALPRLLFETLLGWRRNFYLSGLAIVCLCVLLLY